MRTQRRAISSQQQNSHSLAICQKVASSSIFRNSQRIAVYIENDGEIAITPLIATILSHGKQCYLPALRPMQPNRLWFSEYRPGNKLHYNRYNIIEPDIRRHKPVKTCALDLVLVPLVAFDTTGNRMGMGGGFYDRTFAFLKSRKIWFKPTLIGVAHELQKVDSIEANRWDIPLDGVVTEVHSY